MTNDELLALLNTWRETESAKVETYDSNDFEHGYHLGKFTAYDQVIALLANDNG